MHNVESSARESHDLPLRPAAERMRPATGRGAIRALGGTIVSDTAELHSRIRAHDWSTTPLGPFHTWPPSYHTAVNLCLAAREPTLVWLGPDLIMLYNDACRLTLGERLHARALGLPGQAGWPEAWPHIGPVLTRVLASGQPITLEDQPLVIERGGLRGEYRLSFHLMPIHDADGRVAGIFSTVVEVAPRHAERHLATLGRLLSRTSEATSPDEVCARAARVLGEEEADLAFALFYLVDADGSYARLAGCAGIQADTPASPRVVDLSHRAATWPLASALATGQTTTARVPDLPRPAGSRLSPSTDALVLPLHPPDGRRPPDLLVLGLGPRRAPDGDDRAYGELIAAQVATAIGRARARGTSSPTTTAGQDEPARPPDRRAGAIWTRAMRDTVPVMVWMTNQAAELVYVNQNWLDFSGLSLPEELSGGYVARVEPLDLPSFRQAVQEAHAARQPFEITYRRRRHDGIYRWITDRGFPVLDSTGAFGGFVGSAIDVTERHEAAEEIDRLIASEQAARTAAEQAMAARDTFLSIAAHEMKTPIAGVQVATQLLLRQQARGDLDAARLTRTLTMLDRAAHRLTLLTDELLDVSRLRSGQLFLDVRPVDVGATLAAAIDQARQGLDAAHRLIWEPPTRPIWIMADRRRLGQVFSNVLDNAIKYSPGGGEIVVVLRQERDGAYAGISDTGIGLPPEATESIFEPFGRAANATRRYLPGMSLGLFICRGIVERHGGRIWATSAGEDLGTTVHIWLPWEPRGPATEPTT
jgi:PAS domain S-box-containing protein